MLQTWSFSLLSFLLLTSVLSTCPPTAQILDRISQTLPPLRPCTPRLSSRGLCPTLLFTEVLHPWPSSTSIIENHNNDNVYIRPVITFFGVSPPLQLVGEYSNGNKTTVELEHQDFFGSGPLRGKLGEGYLPLDVVPAVGERLSINVHNGKRIKGIEGMELIVGREQGRTDEAGNRATVIYYRQGTYRSEFPESGVRVERKKRRKKPYDVFFASALSLPFLPVSGLRSSSPDAHLLAATYSSAPLKQHQRNGQHRRPQPLLPLLLVRRQRPQSQPSSPFSSPSFRSPTQPHPSQSDFSFCPPLKSSPASSPSSSSSSSSFSPAPPPSTTSSATLASTPTSRC